MGIAPVAQKRAATTRIPIITLADRAAPSGVRDRFALWP